MEEGSRLISNVEDPPQGNGAPDDRDQRIDALRDLAREGVREKPLAPPDIASMPPAPAKVQRPRKALLLAGISALIVVLVVGGLVARAVVSSAPAKQPQASVTRVIDPKSDGVSCPKDASWSPDGRTLALLGYQQTCPNDYPGTYAYHPGVIVFYDQTVGRVTSTIQPDSLITTALQLKPPTIATPDPYASGVGSKDTSHQVIDYAHLLWSPDGKQLAAPFSVLLTTKDLGNGGFDTQSVQGVLLVSPSGGDERVLSHTLVKNEWYSGLWNLATGAYIPVNTPTQASTDRGWYAAPPFSPPALGYQWTSDGRLQPVTPLNTTSAPASHPDTPVGQPDGGKTFSIWQPGYVQLTTRWFGTDPLHTLHTLKTPVETWTSSLASWSADGAYLYAGGLGDDIANWRIALPGQPTPDPADLTGIGLVGAPVLPVRDAGMAAILRRYHDTSINPDAWATQVNLAWSPDGKRVAVEAPVARPDGSVQLSDFAVGIYDCASGKLLKTLTPKLQLASVAPYGGFGSEVFLRWSPDGRQLLLYYPLLNGAQIWGSRDLPR